MKIDMNCMLLTGNLMQFPPSSTQNVGMQNFEEGVVSQNFIAIKVYGMKGWFGSCHCGSIYPPRKFFSPSFLGVSTRILVALSTLITHQRSIQIRKRLAIVSVTLTTYRRNVKVTDDEAAAASCNLA
jgi:hypothetical protein